MKGLAAFFYLQSILFASAFVSPTIKRQRRALPFNDERSDDGRQRIGPCLNKRQNVDDIVSKIGLDTVKKKSKKKSKKKTKMKSQSTQMNNGNVLLTLASNIGLQVQLDYARNGHAALRDFINPDLLQQIRKDVLQLAADEELQAWRQKVQVAANSPELAASCQTVNECQRELNNLGITASLPFLQYFNTWRKLPRMKELAFSLGEAAALLMDVPSVRLYQDSVFWKRAGDGPTPWHIDAKMAPFDTSHFITFWIPLADVPSDGTALLFCSKSHSDFALPYWNPITDSPEEIDEDTAWERLDSRYPKEPTHHMPMKLSDATIHSGWTLHCADGNADSNHDRAAVAVSFVDARAEIRDLSQEDATLGDNEDQWSYQEWVDSVPRRKPFQHDLVPIVWPIKSEKQ